jgi:hypothetical protein
VELIVQPDAHDVAVEARRGLRVVNEEGLWRERNGEQIGYTAEIIAASIPRRQG